MTDDNRHLFADEQAYIAHQRYLAQVERDERLKAAQARKKRRRVQYSERILRALNNLKARRRLQKIYADPIRHREYLDHCNELRRAAVLRNPDVYRRQNQRAYQKARDIRILLARDYYATHHEQCLDTAKRYRAEHAEKIKENKRLDRERNRDKYVAKAKERYQRNREEILAKSKEYRERRIEDIRAYDRERGRLRRMDAEYRARNVEYVRAYRARKKATRLTAESQQPDA